MSFLSKDLGWKDIADQTALKKCSIHQEAITNIFLHQNSSNGQNKQRRLACMECISQNNGAKNISIKQAIEYREGQKLLNWPPSDEVLIKEVEQQIQIHQNSKLQQVANEFWERFQQTIIQKIETAKAKTLFQVQQIYLQGEKLHQQYLSMISASAFFDRIQQNRSSLEQMEKEIDKYIDQTYQQVEQNNEVLKRQCNEFKEQFQQFSIQEGLELERFISQSLENISFYKTNQSTFFKQSKKNQVENAMQYQSNQMNNSLQNSPQQQYHKKSSSDMKSSIASPQFNKFLNQMNYDERFGIECSLNFEMAKIKQIRNEYDQFILIDIPEQISSQIGCQFYSSYNLQNDKFYDIQITFKNKISSNSKQGICFGLIADDYKDTLIYMNSSYQFSIMKGLEKLNSLISIGNGSQILEYNKSDLNFHVQICIKDNILRIVPRQENQIKSSQSPTKKTNQNIKQQQQNQIQNNSIINTNPIERNQSYRFCIFVNQPGQIIKITPYNCVYK
ncbi:hypothetical protein TTHERM_00824060 (macronuclear) [Tetrahymena thermophila SB210]|uniref:Uncharacterized protein n=1 Tax=Tetrahymena thermophila (strain SB210) TaxID=312017 RepID=I7MFE8_TETTS|nr:hypothetical protein TTHERM_00824060 [Tetrahymena thermophila SB210]EAR83843.1 hypothetical protein TTHERM_00824060 [Tetrahymena thermophila SB210]|eukprot:XP_001031506.1 hypothetical protein TTHERM_00824060 [Tetrahymena thermophila SB210]